ncbi:MAG TPA: DUF4249 domain-containing protein [Bacteroidia bacterium]|nr:DUF4249 domain-containing protein [Bacteroidia bacterium]
MSLITVSVISSCEKDITLDLPQAEQKLVVEGYITPGQPAYVFLSRTAGVYDPLDSASLLNYSVFNATVFISDGINTDTLVQVDPSVGYLYISPGMLGQVGNTYTLTVITKEGETATAITHIDPPVALDSVWFETIPELDSLGWTWARLTDPDTLGNRYRWFAKRLGKDDDFIAPIGSPTEDKFYNGLSFDFAYNRGEVPYSDAEDDNNIEEGYFKLGDTIVVKFASITKDSYEFWRAAETQSSNNGNPFGSITPLISNINGGIGIWEGYSFTLDTLIAQ